MFPLAQKTTDLFCQQPARLGDILTMPPCCLDKICRGTASSGGATEVVQPSLQAGVLPASPPKDRLCWGRNQEPAKGGDGVGNAAESRAGAEASQGERRSFAVPVIWPAAPKKVCLFNKNIRKEKKRKKK